MPDERAAAPKQLGGVRQASAPKKEQANPAGEHRDGEDSVPGPLGRSKADGQRVVIVIDELDRAGQALAHLRQHRTGLGRNAGAELGDESGQLPGGGGCGGLPPLHWYVIWHTWRASALSALVNGRGAAAALSARPTNCKHRSTLPRGKTKKTDAVSGASARTLMGMQGGRKIASPAPTTTVS